MSTLHEAAAAAAEAVGVEPTYMESIEASGPAESTEVVDDGGQAQVGDVAGEQPVEEQYEVLDPEQYGDHRVPVTVDGKTEYVPYREAVQGVMRQSDYTRKTQELATQRQEVEQAQALVQALQVNPQGTIQWLQQQFGVEGAQQVADQARSTASSYEQDDWLSDDGYSDSQSMSPVEQRLAALEQERAHERAVTEYRSEFARLGQKYGDEFSPQDVALRAQELGITDPRYMETVYRDIAFQRQQARGDAQSAKTAEQTAADNAKRIAAAQAAQTVTAGPSATGTQDRVAAPANKRLSVAEAWALAEEQLANRR